MGWDGPVRRRCEMPRPQSRNRCSQTGLLHAPTYPPTPPILLPPPPNLPPPAAPSPRSGLDLITATDLDDAAHKAVQSIMPESDVSSLKRKV